MSKNTIMLNTSSVKVQFMTSSKDFTATMAKYWVAINEMADKVQILRQNVQIEKAWATKHTSEEEQKKAQETIDAYQKRHDEFKKELDKRLKDCYELLTDELYSGYTSDSDQFTEAIKAWFKDQKIEPTDTLVRFMREAVGYKNSSNKQLQKTGNALSFKTEKTFQKSFMLGLCQLMKDKNALKTDAYKYEFKPLEK